MNLRFAGQYFDEETGTHYNQQRDYAPGLGRYVQRDPIGLSGGINVYGYGYGNPLAYADPDGLVPLVLTPCVTSPQGAMACAALIGATATAVANACSNAVSAINDWMFSDGGEKPANTPDPASGSDSDRGDLTKAGRAQQKHGDRAGSAFDPARGTAKDKNEQGQRTLDSIVKSPDRVDKPNRHGGIDVLESPGGRGARFGPDGRFTGFLEP